MWCRLCGAIRAPVTRFPPSARSRLIKKRSLFVERCASILIFSTSFMYIYASADARFNLPRLTSHHTSIASSLVYVTRALAAPHVRVVRRRAQVKKKNLNEIKTSFLKREMNVNELGWTYMFEAAPRPQCNMMMMMMWMRGHFFRKLKLATTKKWCFFNARSSPPNQLP